MSKIFSFFTKDGRVEVPIKEADIKQAAQIAQNPLTSLVEKVREMSDLSNKLIKAQSDQVAQAIEKIEFTDVDGRTITLIKGGPGSGRHDEGGTKFHSETKHGMYHTFKTPNNKTGVVFKPTGSMSPERMTGEFNNPLDANSAIARHDAELGKMAKDAGNAIQAIGKEETKPEHTPEELAEFEKEKAEHPEFSDEQIWQIIADHAVEKGGPGSGPQ